MGVGQGQRLPSLRTLADRYGASLGAIHRALTQVEDAGAATIEQHGRAGTVLQVKSVGLLYGFIRSGPFVVALPVPGSPRIAGLATGLKASLIREQVPAYLCFYAGSRQRLDALRRRLCDVAVVSGFAAQDRTGSEAIAIELPPRSYVSDHLVYYQPKSTGNQLRVAIDRDATDLERLAELEFASAKPTFVPATYTQFTHLLREGTIDAAIWNADEATAIPEGVQSRPLSADVRRLLKDSNTRAALLVRTNDEVAVSLLRATVHPAEIMRIQEEVVHGHRVPEY